MRTTLEKGDKEDEGGKTMGCGTGWMVSKKNPTEERCGKKTGRWRELG